MDCTASTDSKEEHDNDNSGIDNMNSLHPSGTGACFAHGTLVTINTGATKPIQELRSGDIAQTLAGELFVVSLLRTRVENEIMCRLGDIFVTAWHPVSLQGIDWYFPVHLTTEPIMYTGEVYSVLLEVDNSPFAHTIHLGSVWAATLGHGITSTAPGDDGTPADVRGHPFFGNYLDVCSKISILRPMNGAYQYYGTLRDPTTGWVNGFRVDMPSYGGASYDGTAAQPPPPAS
ncbi:hypothetical protein LMH87_007336 [Akanthomyces muscarius]|uniref:Vint domain-containing protein n=1 Tax=Akanthomyces muscarius TaxID=2231603 RepID=A0A9W8USC0_AKAMU|nr:hypothetical protein LMH87_007336 [Akanthomyces muscarius]KAJ4165716.1 hypothetical protein LMH87_007336 [Akanthomyces muscarius]